MTKDTELWNSLKHMPIGPCDAELSFHERLARENGWSLDFSKRVVLEYKKFIFLIAASQGKTQLTPSDEVDQAWHLHLSYTRDYWDVMCQKILGFPLHHGPTSGGKIEREKYFAQYDATLKRYKIVFKSDPPSDIWPRSDIRFSGRWRRINTQRNFVLPRAKIYAAALIPATAVLATCTSAGITPDDLIIIGLFFICIAIFVLYIRGRLRGKRISKRNYGDADGGCGSSDGSSEGSDSGGCGGGGCGGD